jgi:hypothetical protein
MKKIVTYFFNSLIFLIYLAGHYHWWNKNWFVWIVYTWDYTPFISGTKSHFQTDLWSCTIGIKWTSKRFWYLFLWVLKWRQLMWLLWIQKTLMSSLH